MKKIYEKPMLEVEELEVEDVMYFSLPVGTEEDFDGSDD